MDTTRRTESSPPQFSAYLNALQGHFPPFNRATALVAAVSLPSYGEIAVGKGFQVEGLRFLQVKTPAERMQLLPRNDMAMLCETQKSLSDRCSVSFLSAGGPTGESLVTAAVCLLGDLCWCSCYDNTEGVAFAFVLWLTASNSVFEFSDAPQ